MSILIAGILAWAVLHLYPSVAAGHRSELIHRFGKGRYKAAFALGIILSIFIMVNGWRAIEPVVIYSSPEQLVYPAYLCMLTTFILFVAARTRNNIKQYLRHPQLTGVVFWSIGHLLVNGDNRSLVLFGMLGFWAILEMVLINRRDGVWVKPVPVSKGRDALVVGGGIILFGVIWWLHPYLSGVSLGS
ncbi:MAG: NnrU family protein [Gammaproteobacteria bacterium]|nr:NnrU family protein [Gammaproteobacteria bacterium]